MDGSARQVLLGVGISTAVAGLLYILFKKWMENVEADEGFSEKGSGEPLPKRVLVLGLDGAGKSSLLACLSGQSKSADAPHEPTGGFNVVSIQNDKAASLDIWEVGGAENIRKYWSNFIQDTEVLVFVVDATDRERFSEAYTEMHRLLGEPRLLNKPFVVLANKQDQSDAAKIPEVREALGLEDVKHHRVQIVETTLSPPSDSEPIVAYIKGLLIKL